ncbi:MAG: CvpA family protein [Sedimentisphaerales bacterium]|nr:CvpA family protein [Sedimentisphaerales bacterium]
MAGLVVMIIILGCAAFQYFKGTFIRALATIFIAICAGIVAFGFFEPLANLIISRSSSGSLLAIVSWAQPICFILLFIIVFGALQTGMIFLTLNKPVNLGFLPERIGRVTCGIVLGLLLSGFLLTVLGLAPLPEKYPYQRFDGKRNKVLLNPDGLATGLFGIVSKGSLSGKRSFATVHPDFIDQIHLNREVSGISILTAKTPAISLPRPTEPAVWPTPTGLNEQITKIVSDLNRQNKLKDDSNNKTLSMPKLFSNDYQAHIVRIGINKNALSSPKISAGNFQLSQIRLICKRRGLNGDPLSGAGINVYPIGHMKDAGRIQTSTEITLKSNEHFENNAMQKWIDFVFCIPRDYQPVLVQFKQNNILEISTRAIVTADKAPPPVYFNYSG